MTTCPVCGQPMPLTRSDNRPRHYCSQPCASQASRAAQLAAIAAQPVDPAAVYRLTHGQRVESTKAERLEAVRLLRAQGRTYAQVAESLHVTAKSVARYVSELKNRKEVAA